VGPNGRWQCHRAPRPGWLPWAALSGHARVGLKALPTVLSRPHRLRACAVLSDASAASPWPELSILAVPAALSVSAVAAEAAVRAGVLRGRGCGAPRPATPPRQAVAVGMRAPRAVGARPGVRAQRGSAGGFGPVTHKLIFLFFRIFSIPCKLKFLCSILFNSENYETIFVE
jgi:hypothetical protein